MARTEYTVGTPELDAYRLLTSLVLPRPIAWVATVDEQGVGNLAPHSFFNMVSGDPPMVMFASIGGNHTVANCRATGEFTISVVTEELAPLVNGSAAKFAAEVDEAAALGIEMAPAATVRTPYVAASPAAMECRVHQIVELPTSYVVIGEVLHVSVDDGVLTDGKPDIDKIRPMSRLGDNLWGYSPAHVSIDRPGPVQ